MNVIVSNKYQSLLNSLNIDIIKSINGVFTVEELVAQFSNFYYNKMIIDITAIKNYTDINVIQTLSVNFDMTRIILVLDDSEQVNSPMYLSQLVSMGIYNFTSNVDTVPFLINNPNSYKDVAQFHNLNGFTTNKLNETNRKVTHGKMDQKIIGFRNITDHAGSTTLVFLLKKHLENLYKVSAAEVDGSDFVFFNDRSLKSITNAELSEFIASNSAADVILLDLNVDIDDYCDEVIYLIEPGLVKLNKLIRRNKDIFNELNNKKIVLNRSVLEDKDVTEFEKESGSKVFYNLPCIDDKLDNQPVINNFLSALGFSRIEAGSGKGIFNIFK